MAQQPLKFLYENRRLLAPPALALIFLIVIVFLRYGTEIIPFAYRHF